MNIEFDNLKLTRYSDEYNYIKDELENGISKSSYIHDIGKRLEASKNKENIFDSAFIVSDDDNSVGYLFISNSRNDEVFLEYALLKDFRGMGYARELVENVTNYLFDEHNIRSIRLDIDPSNEASMNVAEACGFVEDEEEYASRNYCGRIQFVKDSYNYISKRSK